MLSMGGYGIYIWPAYGLVLVGFCGLMILSLRQAKQVKRRLQSQLKK
ncbi:MAG: heme exporter protein CcmD [Gammaproteobacteria bacterium 39-13]|jgi:heme exporter protein CcmD|nr:heme exporter protein CcmD [Gammaproteobacteria bacterium]OJV92274.1 MAG: heme exporter protein CcmD [Gammaproteobacteria bacterium 39-13]